MTQGDDGPAEKRASTAPETADHGSSIIQFSADAFYCRNTDGSIEVDVVRIGDVHSAVVVDYETEDGSARGGEEYARTIGSVMFSEGEYIQKIRVQVASSKIWRPTLYFMIRLNAAGSSGGAFKECRVWILHQGAFPAAEFGGSDGGTPSASGMTSSAAAAIFSHPKGSGEESHLAALAAKIRLLYAFYKKCFAVEVVGKGTLKMLAVDSLDNLLFLWQLVLSVFFVDHVLTQLRLDDVARTQAAVLPLAIAIGLAHALPVIIINRLKVGTNWYGVGGGARKSLQVDILRMYLSFTDTSRKRVGPAGFIEALYRDSVEVIDNGFMATIRGAASTGRIVAILLFTAYNTPHALPLQLALPVFMLHRMYYREELATVLRLKYFHAQNRMLSHAEAVSHNFSLIRDYHLRPVMGKKMGAIVDDVNYFANAVGAHTAQSQLALPLASALLAGALMACAPYILPYLHMTSGLFLATLAATQQMGEAAEKLFAALMEISLSISALLKIFSFMNLQTETNEMMLASNKQRERGRKVAEDSSLQALTRKAAPKWQQKLGLSAQDSGNRRTTGAHRSSAPQGNGDATATDGGEADSMLLEMIGVGISTPGTEGDGNGHAAASGGEGDSTHGHTPTGPASALRDVNLQLKQGRVYAVVGPHAGGKSYFLRLLGKAIYPTHGEVFVPPHLSIIHVEQSPQIFGDRSLYENLVVGIEEKEWPSLDAVCAVCAALGLPPQWLHFLSSTAPPGVGNRNRAKASSSFLVRPSGLAVAPPPPERPKDAERAALVRIEGEDASGNDTIVSDTSGAWEGRLSTSDRHLLQLARALLANPHVLVLHRPINAFEPTLGKRVVEVLRRFVDERGLSSLLDDSPGLLARTVVYTCNTADESALDAVDAIVIVGRPAGGATLMEASLLHDANSHESKAAALARQCSQLVPTQLHHVANEHSWTNTKLRNSLRAGVHAAKLSTSLGQNHPSPSPATPESTPTTPTGRTKKARGWHKSKGKPEEAAML